MHTFSFRLFPSLALATLSLGLAACVAPRVALDDPAGRVVVGEGAPGDGFEALGPIEAVDGQGCGAGGYEGTYDAALVRLKNEAARRFADYVQVTGTAPPAFRPGCFDNAFKLSGVAYRGAGGAVSVAMPSPAPVAVAPMPVPAGTLPARPRVPVPPTAVTAPALETARSAPMPPSGADSPTARKLLELQDLRARNLVTAEEYERLRRKVLSEAY